MTPVDPKQIEAHEFEDELRALDDATAARVLIRYEKAPCRAHPSPAARRAGFMAIAAEERYRIAYGHDPSPALSVVPRIVPIQCLDLAKIAEDGLPEPDWILDDWLIRKDVALIVGGAGIGKSTLAVDMALAFSSGRPWLGMEPDRAYRVGYIDEEAGAASVARLFLRVGDPNGNLFVASGQECRLDSEEGIDRLEHWIEHNRIEILFLDSTAQLSGLLDRHNAGDVAALFMRLFRLRDRHNVTTLMLAHKRKDSQGHGANNSNKLEMALGSVAWGTQSSTVWFCERGVPNQLQVVQVKRRDAQEQSIIACYQETADSRIRLTSGGTVGDDTTKVSGCSEWLVRHVEESEGQTTEKATILDHASRLEEPFDSRTVERAITHCMSLGLLHRPKRGWYRIGREPAKN